MFQKATKRNLNIVKKQIINTTIKIIIISLISCYDEEHSTEGFLTPVYFDRKALIYFISVPDFCKWIFSQKPMDT